MFWIVEAHTGDGNWKEIANYHDEGEAHRMADSLRAQPHYADARVVPVVATVVQ